MMLSHGFCSVPAQFATAVHPIRSRPRGHEQQSASHNGICSLAEPPWSLSGHSGSCSRFCRAPVTKCSDSPKAKRQLGAIRRRTACNCGRSVTPIHASNADRSPQGVQIMLDLQIHAFLKGNMRFSGRTGLWL